MNDEFFISVVGEVFDGYTEAVYKDGPVYIKHLNIRDQRYIHKYYEKYKQIAISRGLETEEDRLLSLEKDGIWDKTDSLKIEEIEKEIESLQITKKSLMLPSMKKEYSTKIEKKIYELCHLNEKKREIVGKTAENYASNRSSEEILRYFIFKDKLLTSHLFSEDEFSELEQEDLNFFVREQSYISTRLSDDNIKKAVLRPFFSMYMSYSEDVSGFFGKPIVELSIYQLRTTIFSIMFHNIFQNVEDIPDYCREDPEKLIGFAESKTKQGSSKKIDEDSDASMVFGATAEDMDILKGDAQVSTLSEELEKAGGHLNMEQMMKLAGH